MEHEKIVGNYRLLKQLGEGAFGSVYLAKDMRDGRMYAIKELNKVRQGGKVKSSIIREVQALKKIKGCPHTLTYHGIINKPDKIYLITEFVEGVTLDKFIHNLKENVYDISNEELLDIMIQLAEALTCIHARGFLHRDLKDANIIINPETSPPQVTVIDFGLSCIMELSKQPTNVEKKSWCKNIKGGNRRYYPNKTFTKEWVFPPDYPFWASDVFALGLIFYRLATGKAVRAYHVPKNIHTGNDLLDDIIELLMLPQDPDLRSPMIDILEDMQDIHDPDFVILRNHR